MTRLWWKTGWFAMMGVALLTSIAGAQIIDNLPYTIPYGAQRVYQFPGETVAFNGIMDGDPWGIDINIIFESYVPGPMTLWTSKDGANWTWQGDVNWMINAAQPYAKIRLDGESWDPDDWAKYVRIDNYTYGPAIVVTAVVPLFPGRDPTLPAYQSVGIDIKPGSYPNSLNINGNGAIPVAILGSATFDVALIDPSTLLFNGSALRVRGQNPGWHFEDVSGDFSTSLAGAPDGYLDLVCQFVDDPTQWVEGAATAEVKGKLLDGTTPIAGTDSVNIVRITNP